MSAPAQAAAAPAAPAPPAGRCGEPIPGWRAFLKPGRVVVLGDVLGSNEIPAFVGDAACQAAESGHAVHVGLEIPRVEQSLVDAYLQSDGSPAARALLLGGGMWHRMYEDGKSSTAIFDLIERARVLSKQGLPVRVFYFDELGDPGSPKEFRMARNIQQRWEQSQRDLFLVLTGNVHARTIVGVPWDQSFAPMAYHLIAAVPDVVSLDAHYTGGYTWGCRFSRWGKRVKCRTLAVAPPNRVIREADLPRRRDGTTLPRFVGVWGGSAGDGYHGIYFVGRLSAAQPATEPGMALR